MVELIHDRTGTYIRTVVLESKSGDVASVSPGLEKASEL